MYTKRKQQRKNSRSGRRKTQRGGLKLGIGNLFTSNTPESSSASSVLTDRLKSGLSGITGNSDAAETFKQGMGAAKVKLGDVRGQISDQISKIKEDITAHGDLPETVQALQTQVETLQAELDKLKGKVDANNEMYITLLELLTTTIQTMNREVVFKEGTGKPTKDGINNNIPKMQALVQDLRSSVG